MTGALDMNRFVAARDGYSGKLSDLLAEHGSNECFQDEMTDAGMELLELERMKAILGNGNPDDAAHVLEVYGDLVPTWEKVAAEDDDTFSMTFEAFKGRPIYNRAENDRTILTRNI